MSQEIQSCQKEKNFPQVYIDLKLLTETQNKLANGCPVETHIVNIFLLRGIQNILSQNDDFDDAFEKIKVHGIENTETKLRIESFEIWPITLDDKIKDVSARADTSGNNEGSEHLENNMKALCSDFAALIETIAFAALSKQKRNYEL